MGANTGTGQLSFPENGNAPPRPRAGWIALADQRPPYPSPLLLVTNNINASNRYGCMSHVWLTNMLHYGNGDPGDWSYPLAFDEHSDRRILGITHWRYAVPSEGEGLAPSDMRKNGKRMNMNSAAEQARRVREIAARVGSHPRHTVEDRIVDTLHHDIADRRGLKWEWDKIEPDVMEELLDTWREIIRQELAAAPFAPPEGDIIHFTCPACGGHDFDVTGPDDEDDLSAPVETWRVHCGGTCCSFKGQYLRYVDASPAT